MSKITEQDILRTFNKSFKSPHVLWKAMAWYCCLLSGSRSLEFFVPASSSEESDWDFYVAPNVHCVLAMISALEKTGVEFDSPFARFEKLFLQGGEYYVSQWEADVLIDSFDRHWQRRRPHSESLLKLMECLREYCRDGVATKTKFRVTASAKATDITFYAYPNPEYDHIPGLTVLRGRTAVDRGNHVVQLMFAPEKSPTDHILQYHSSAVQCFISPYACGHFYHDLAQDKKSLRWDGNTTGHSITAQPLSPRRDAALDKYRQRGYDVSYRQKGPAGLRHLSDARARLQPFSSLEILAEGKPAIGLIGVGEGLVQRRMESLTTLAWREEDNTTTPLRSHETVPQTISQRLSESMKAQCTRHAFSSANLSLASPGDIVTL